MNAKKSRHTRLYINEADEPLLDKVCEASGLTQTMVMTLLVSSGLKAIQANSYRWAMPLNFRIGESEEAPVRPRSVSLSVKR